MNINMVLYVLGKVLWIGAILLVLPLIVTIIYNENDLIAFAIPILIMMALSLLLGMRKPGNEKLYAKEGFFIVALSWIVLSAFGALPFYLSGNGLSYLDCLFESVSGITTTGSSIFTNVEAMSHGLLFWRSFTHWVGGMGVLVFVLAVLPQSDSHSMYVLRAEVPGPQVGKLVAKIKFTVRILYVIYFFMTLLEAILLILGGMPVFDSIVNSFSTAGTGGFAIKNNSIAFYNSAYIDIVIGVFMLLFGINFNIYYFIIAGNLKQALRSEELRWYLAIIAAATGLISINVLSYFDGFGESLRHAFFQVSSIITTTGFATTDFNLWPNFSRVILVLIMFVGACAGSTGGGIKVSRIIILFKSTINEMRRMLSPNSINLVKFESRALETGIVRSVSVFFSVFILITAASILVLALDDVSLVTAFTAVVACINNVGPGLEVVGPMGNFSSLAPLSKVVLIFDMLAGRLELFPILLIFSPRAWSGR